MCSSTGRAACALLPNRAVSEQLHRALEVGEEDGDLLALAFQGGLGGEDLLGEVLGSVRLRGGRMNRGRGARGHSMAALEAEAGTPGQFRATGVAGERGAGAAAEAEPSGAGLSCWHRGQFMPSVSN
jgi:hypothetical protein